MENNKVKKYRIWEIDFLRGFCILLMILDHAMYDLAYIFHYSWAKLFFQWPLRNALWWVAVFCFVAISGISSNLSKSNLLRGSQLAIIAVVLSLATFLMDKLTGQSNVYIVRFGILHMLALSMILYSFIKERKLVAKGILSLLCIFIGIYFVNNPLKQPLAVMGALVKSIGAFYSSDYFPLLPWFGFFVLGGIIGMTFYKDKKSLMPLKKKRKWMEMVQFVGKYSLFFYLLHQPIIYGILKLIV